MKFKLKFKEAVLETFRNTGVFFVRIGKGLPLFLLVIGVLLFLAVPSIVFFGLIELFRGGTVEAYLLGFLLWLVSQLVWAIFWLSVIGKMIEKD